MEKKVRITIESTPEEVRSALLVCFLLVVIVVIGFVAVIKGLEPRRQQQLKYYEQNFGSYK